LGRVFLQTLSKSCALTAAGRPVNEMDERADFQKIVFYAARIKGRQDNIC